MTHAERYAQMLFDKYGLEPKEVSLDDETYNTVGKVADAVLPNDVYWQWKRDFMAEVNELRKEFGKKPI